MTETVPAKCYVFVFVLFCSFLFDADKRHGGCKCRLCVHSAPALDPQCPAVMSDGANEERYNSKVPQKHKQYKFVKKYVWNLPFDRYYFGRHDRLC